MRQRGYLIAFVLVLLTACVGGFFGGRFLIRRLQQDFGPQATWAPPTVPPAVMTPKRRFPSRGVNSSLAKVQNCATRIRPTMADQI